MKIQMNGPAPKPRNDQSCPISNDAALSPAVLRLVKSHHETADNYIGVIIHLDEEHRVIICKDALQWIIQVKRGQKRSQPQWVGKSYLTTAKAVIAASDALCGPLGPDTLAKLHALPSKPEVQQ